MQIAIPGALVAALATLLVAPTAIAQQVKPSDQPLEPPAFQSEDDGGAIMNLPDVPDFEPEQRDAEPVLPSLVLPDDIDDGGLEAGVRVRVERIELTGNTAFADEDLAFVTHRYEGRSLGYADIQRLQDELTQAHVSAGYVNSGAVIPKQKLREGVLRVEIVEGSVASIEIVSDGRFHDAYLRSRLASATATPVNLYELEERLQLLQTDQRIRKVDATFVPGDERGQALLRIEIAEAQPWRLDIEGNNFSSPLVDEWRGVFGVGHRNITGFGDGVYAEYKLSKGLDDIGAHYVVPVTRWDTRFELFTRHTWSNVEEDPFDVLDIESRTQTYGIGLAQPVYRTPRIEAEVFVRGEWRRSKAILLERPLPVNRRLDGVNKIAPLRLGLNFSQRSSRQVIAAHSMLSFGFDILGATKDSGNTPDAKFVAWLTQLQFATRLPFLNAEIVSRGDLQLADRPLVGIERMGLGGHFRVRGYRENQVVGDNGVAGSLELRVPVPLPSASWIRAEFEIAPFVDAGHSWNSGREDPQDPDLVSIGIGGRLRLNDRLRLVAYWGHDLVDVDTIGEDSVQGDGFHLGVRLSL